MERLLRCLEHRPIPVAADLCWWLDVAVTALRHTYSCCASRLSLLELSHLPRRVSSHAPDMASSEIREIDNKIANLNTMRKIVLDRLAGLEQDEIELEHDLNTVENKLEDLQEELDDAAALAQKAPAESPETSPPADSSEFMSESIYQKIPTPSPKSKKKRTVPRRVSMPILHEHLESG